MRICLKGKMLAEFFLIRSKMLGLLKGLFKSSDIVLDIGCGDKPYYHQSIKSKIASRKYSASEINKAYKKSNATG